MKITTALLPNYGRTGNYTGIDDEVIAVLIISFLHHNKKINDDRLNAMFKSLRKGTLLRFINTYHCRINDKWYSDERMLQILCEVYYDTCPVTELTLDEFLKYLNLYLNANKNYCINWVYSKLVEPLIYCKSDRLKSFGIDIEIPTYEDFERKESNRGYSLGFGFCCEDCDGDYGQYKYNQYEYRLLNKIVDETKAKVKSFLLSKKTHQKNPYDFLK